MTTYRPLLILLALTVSSSFAADTEPAYLTQSEVNRSVSLLEELEYPMTQGEVLAKLGLKGRQLPGMVASSKKLKNPGPQYFFIHLTQPDAGPRDYVLYLWFDQNPQQLAGEAFVAARNIEYAEILLSENGVKDGDRITYVAQSSRYPFIRLSYAERKIRKD